VELAETEKNNGIFMGKYTVLIDINNASVKVAYGYLGFEKSVLLVVTR
jgi:hypothetical protein